MLTDFCATDDIATTARRTGFGQRPSKITGQLVLARVTFGHWRDAKTTFAPLAATVPQVVESLRGAPEALYQRMPPRAHAFLQAMIQHALARIQADAPVCDEGLLTAFPQGPIADSTGFVLPDSRQDAVPGSGGSAGKAGAKIQAGWDSNRSLLAHFMRTPLHLPDQQYIDPVITCAPPGALFIVDLGYFQLQALAPIAAAGAYFFSRLHHQASLYAATAEGVRPVELARGLRPVPGPLLEPPSSLGATGQVAARLSAARVPEAIVNARRRKAKEKAKKKGDTPSQAYLAL